MDASTREITKKTLALRSVRARDVFRSVTKVLRAQTSAAVADCRPSTERDAVSPPRDDGQRADRSQPLRGAAAAAAGQKAVFFFRRVRANDRSRVFRAVLRVQLPVDGRDMLQMERGHEPANRPAGRHRRGGDTRSEHVYGHCARRNRGETRRRRREARGTAQRQIRRDRRRRLQRPGRGGL